MNIQVFYRIDGLDLDYKQLVRKFPKKAKMFNTHFGQLKEFVREKTCNGHTSILISNLDNNEFIIQWCCEKLITKEPTINI